MKTRRIAICGGICAAVLATLAPASAQLAAPNSTGVAMGHYHLFVQNIETQRNFWKVLGGTAVTHGGVEYIQIPGVILMLEQSGPRGGTEGSVVGHIGFKVRAIKEALEKFEAGGWKITPSANPKQFFVAGPDAVRVELIDDASIGAPAENHHTHFFTPDVLAMQAWYAKVFGAVPGKRAQFDAADIPGANLTFSAATTPVVATKGRVLDRIGFEVKGLESFCKRLEADGVTFDRRYSQASAVLTDPWGTSIELTEGLRGR